jgi:hypothetical protein
MFALKEQKCVYVSIQIKNVCGSTYNEKQMTRNPSSLTKLVNVNKKIIKKKKKYAHVLLFLIF